eukprot:gnl/TRDRNA2_/TRDRNA2_167206_c2_seq1.p1 gnl/TRDRNA2_/TRDRNA2_167206_c2~~gnl/TRDRNA2_/TRDRNA2_167206_c2_seq1.p1  ORF type:complete len:547 (+),score=85.23 gnl/TRDRNA2_/TRDRNA2_167206_c2_seq1:106-1746(+)
MPGLFVLEAGVLHVFKRDGKTPDPGQMVFTHDQMGNSFGELALLYNCPRTATVIAAVDSTVWSIDRETFNHLVKGAMIETRRRHEEFLASVELLRSLSDDERSKIADVLVIQEYKKGDYIIKQGEAGNHFYLMEAGAAQAYMNGQLVKSYVPGQYFGELALIKNQPRMADVIADVTPTKVAALDGDSFRRLMGNVLEEMDQLALKYGPAAKDNAAMSRKFQPQPAGIEWTCEAKACGFKNFGRASVCLRCGTKRTPGGSLAITSSDVSRPMDLNESPDALAFCVELSNLHGRGPGVVVARYSQRRAEVGVVQGRSPLVPGERFRVTVRSLGTFGEISIGLAPKGERLLTEHSDAPKAGSMMTSFWGPSRGQSGGKQGTRPTVACMVGWGVNECGCHGDHGRWYREGKCPGLKVSPPWEEGDELECGLTDASHVFCMRNGEMLNIMEGDSTTDGYWQTENAFPTVTLHSGGAEVAVHLGGVAKKVNVGTTTARGPAGPRNAAGLLAAMKSTSVAGGSKNQQSLSSLLSIWCGCAEVEVAQKAQQISH